VDDVTAGCAVEADWRKAGGAALVALGDGIDLAMMADVGDVRCLDDEAGGDNGRVAGEDNGPGGAAAAAATYALACWCS
jgi:hypothetical protein